MTPPLGQKEKAQEQLLGIGIPTVIENNCLYVWIEDVQLELSDFEVDFRASLFDGK